MGLAIKVKVYYTDDRGHTETLTSEATETVVRGGIRQCSDPTGLPKISGTPQVGETLTADTSAIEDADGLTNVSYSYQWVGSQSVIDADTGVAYILTFEIPDQTGSTYTLAPADEGWTFEVQGLLHRRRWQRRVPDQRRHRARWKPSPTLRPRESPPSAERPRWGRR